MFFSVADEKNVFAALYNAFPFYFSIQNTEFSRFSTQI